MSRSSVAIECDTGAAAGFVGRKLVGQCRNGAERDRGRLWHAIPADAQRHGPRFGAALCGASPGRLSNGWSEDTQPITCQSCLRRLSRERRTSADSSTATDVRALEEALRADGLTDRVCACGCKFLARPEATSCPLCGSASEHPGTPIEQETSQQ